eukprot:TRINITY_DN2807_c0_g1_i1.p1 TRINITY_DN2807_c0_g1~~TRINITY_DN2807_c0_g1_i1.p1  ORF type:complete len:190 (+),score=33.73 TRINITY_DN2807_c0_g1_i1:88-657(+)
MMAAPELDRYKVLSQVDVVKGNDFGRFLNAVVDDISGRPLDWQKAFGANYNAVETIIDAYRSYMIRAVGLELQKPEIQKQLKSFGVSDADSVVIIETITVRSSDIREGLIRQASNIGKSNLKDFDWKLQLVMASDKISTSRIPLVRLSLTLANGNGTTKDVVLELSKHDLDRFIHSLLEVNKGLQKLRV